MFKASIRIDALTKGFKSKSKVNVDLFKSLVVQNGPFSGIKYPTLESVGSTIFPKLIGSYEKELTPTVENFCTQEYSEVVDIGSAEGYYAVGFAKRISGATVYAYDTDKTARTLCREMAELNNVSDRLIINSECTSEDLRNFKFTGKGLIICDCEGYEIELFKEDNIGNLHFCDLIIETHDFINETISLRLKILFSSTHDIMTINAIEDAKKVLLYNFNDLKGLSLSQRRILFAEGRPANMSWLVCISKSN